MLIRVSLKVNFTIFHKSSNHMHFVVELVQWIPLFQEFVTNSKFFHQEFHLTITGSPVSDGDYLVLGGCRLGSSVHWQFVKLLNYSDQSVLKYLKVFNHYIIVLQISYLTTPNIYLSCDIIIMNKRQDQNLKILQQIVKWINKTQGRDKFSKLIQYTCLLLATLYKDHNYYSLQFQTIFQSLKDARKLFRLFKSLIQYQKLIKILLDDDDNLFKIVRVLGQILFFLYWFVDNISIACKIKLLRGNTNKFMTLSAIFWSLSLVVAIPTLIYESRTKKLQGKKVLQLKLEYTRYIFDLLPALHDSLIFEHLFKIQIKNQLVAMGGIASSLLSTYRIFTES